MKNYRKIFFVVIGVALAMLLGRFAIDAPSRIKIPSLPKNQVLSDALTKQIKDASLMAKINPSVSNLGKLGMVYHSGSFYSEAAICYRLAVKKNSSAWIWSYYLGYLYREMGESVNSIGCFQTVINENPESLHAWYYMGEAYRNLGEFDKAEEAFKKVGLFQEKEMSVNTSARTDLFPLSNYAKCQMASLYMQTNQVVLARESLAEIIQNYKSFGWAFRIIGRVYAMQGDSVFSKKYGDRANDLISYTSPVDTLIDKLALISRSENYLLKQIDEADKTRYFEYESQLVKQGFKYLAENKYLISKAITLYLKTDSAKQALPLLRNHFNLFNNDFNELKYVATLLFEKRYYAQCNIYFTRALELKPGETDIQVFLVFSNYYQDEKQKAMDLMENFYRKDKENPKVVANAVVELLEMEEFEKAESYIELLKQLSPTDSKTFLLSGKIAQYKGDIKKAGAFYESAFNQNPNDILCMQALSDNLMRQKLWEQSLKHFKRSLNYFPNEPYLLEILGTLLVVCPDHNLRNYSEGTEYLERVFHHKDCPPDIAISAGKSLTSAYVALGEKQTATSYMNLVIDFAKSMKISQEYVLKLEAQLNEINSL